MNSDFYGPVVVTRKDRDEIVLLRIDSRDIYQAVGLPTAFNIAGTPYETYRFSFLATKIEECEDIGISKVLDAFREWMEGILANDDLYSIEWRVRPQLEFHEVRDSTATVIDKQTGLQRQGEEVLEAVSIYCRLVVHKNSARPANGVDPQIPKDTAQRS